jgi:DNA adenine methylase
VLQTALFDHPPKRLLAPPKGQLLKWIGNKQRFAQEIVRYFPEEFGSYFEPFLGSGALLAALAPKRGYASDTFAPLVEIWQTLKSDPATLKSWYSKRWRLIDRLGKKEAYETVLASYNSRPNGADLVFLCRACYGGVVRFRKQDGYMSTPCGVHMPISPSSFAKRVDAWHVRVRRTQFRRADYEVSMNAAARGDLVYCDPPYSHSQAILYGAQDFSLAHLLEVIADCKRRGAFVVLSIDGKKRSGNLICDLPFPDGLFEREIFIETGRSMLRRFQMNGQTLEGEVVADRLLLTF